MTFREQAGKNLGPSLITLADDAADRNNKIILLRKYAERDSGVRHILDLIEAGHYADPGLELTLLMEKCERSPITVEMQAYDWQKNVAAQVAALFRPSEAPSNRVDDPTWVDTDEPAQRSDAEQLDVIHDLIGDWSPSREELIDMGVQATLHAEDIAELGHMIVGGEESQNGENR